MIMRSTAGLLFSFLKAQIQNLQGFKQGLPKNLKNRPKSLHIDKPKSNIY